MKLAASYESDSAWAKNMMEFQQASDHRVQLRRTPPEDRPCNYNLLLLGASLPVVGVTIGRQVMQLLDYKAQITDSGRDTRKTYQKLVSLQDDEFTSFLPI